MFVRAIGAKRGFEARHKNRSAALYRRKYGTGFSVQGSSKGQTGWSEEEDEYLAGFTVLTDELVAFLAFAMHRPPSAVRVRHPVALHRQEQREVLARRRLLIADVARRRGVGKHSK